MPTVCKWRAAPYQHDMTLLIVAPSTQVIRITAVISSTLPCLSLGPSLGSSRGPSPSLFSGPLSKHFSGSFPAQRHSRSGTFSGPFSGPRKLQRGPQIRARDWSRENPREGRQEGPREAFFACPALNVGRLYLCPRFIRIARLLDSLFG